MGNKVKASKTEKILLGITAVFLCGLLTLAWQDRRSAGSEPVMMSAETQIPEEELMPDTAPLNLNTASEKDLVALPGIGEELARRIVAYRADNGPFESVEALMNVKGIGEGKLAELDGWITVDGENKK
ncbi:competence protein ComEA [Oscillibacter sp. PC13]|uniref:ComEA family DNA-binding protein n=1 Tax=Oscillibacter sp. PC13 TaxID=1855299 RepID=UPI0008EDC2A0|nr:helix-hairpin-helix domain-containing protein [Oscillibacter sp. PC13]SFP21842.1 competence protein ComEA [Oscillibacter sp. PC13]